MHCYSAIYQSMHKRCLNRESRSWLARPGAKPSLAYDLDAIRRLFFTESQTNPPLWEIFELGFEYRLAMASLPETNR